MRKLIVMLSLFFLCSTAQAATYFVANGGSDAANGTSTATPWATLTKVNNTAFAAGDTISFKRGSTFTGTLNIDSNGTSGNPVTYQAYDTGNAPIIQTATTPPVGDYSHAVDIFGDWNVVKNLFIRHAHEAGVLVRVGANNNVISDNEITIVGVAVYVLGNDTIVTRNNVHDLVMVVNDSGNPDNDYGANGFQVEGTVSNVEFSYNRCVNCIAPSFDYGTDGGFVEFFTGGGTISNISIHHNYAENTNGFTEFNLNGTISNVTISYNVLYGNPHGGFCLHDGSAKSNIKIENNTIVKTSGSGSRVIDCFTGTASWLTVRNNIIRSNVNVSASTTFAHSYNRYHMTGGAVVGYTLGTGESSGDPLFVNVGTGDLHLQVSSPARDTGTALGYTLDYENHPVPIGSAPDMGAYEYGEQRCEVVLTLD